LTGELEQLVRVGYREARRIVILVFGMTVLLVGLAMLVLPGPGILVVIAGLAILGIEFAWARGWLRKVREAAGKAQDRVRRVRDGRRE